MKSSPKFKLPAFLVQLTSQSSQVLKYNKAGRSSEEAKGFFRSLAIFSQKQALTIIQVLVKKLYRYIFMNE